mgnify:CR=1 FL=1
MKAQGTHALSIGAWVLLGVGALGAAAIFLAAALAAGLSIYMPLYAALLCSAGLLLAIGAACVGTATRKPNTSNQLVEVPVQPFTLSDMTYRLLEEEIHARPGKAAAAAVVAGFILGALEALEKRKGRSVS